MTSLKAVSIFILLVSIISSMICADTPGALLLPDSDEQTATFSWSGYLYSGQRKTITLEVYDESYIQERYVGNKNHPTVTFLVFHDDASGWGTAIQSIAKEQFTGPGGYVEKANLPLRREADRWVGEIVIMPSESIRALEIWKYPNRGIVHFGVAVDIFTQESMPAECTAEQVERASQLHKGTWEEFVDNAVVDQFYKYALYSSRIIAVKHPEIYLQADGMFVEHITTQPGFAAAYKERAPHAEGFYTGFSGPPFDFDQVDYSDLQTIPCKGLYPSEAPFFGLLDRRVLSVASCLKTALGTVTELEKAFIYYFDRREEAIELPFIIYCDNECAYLSMSRRLFSVCDGSETNDVEGNPILIFNEKSVWYPLMGRDDTPVNRSLKNVVGQYATDVTTPAVTAFEQQVIDKLRSVTGLTSLADRQIAAFSAVLGLSYESRLYCNTAKQLTPDYPGEIWRYVSYYQSHLASYLSPFASYLAGSIKNADWESMRGLTNQWHFLYRTQHGHIWPREGAGGDLVHKTIDGMLRNRYGHCVQHAASISAVLDLAGVTNYHFDTNPNGDSRGGHSFVSVPEIGCVISNGELQRELHTVLDAGTPFEGNQIWNTLRYAGSGTRWATPYVGFYCGNWAPGQLAQELTFLESLYNDEIHGYRSNYGYGCLDKHFCKQFMDSSKYIPALRGEEWNWREFQYP